MTFVPTVGHALTAHNGRIDAESETFIPLFANGHHGDNGAGIGRDGDPAFTLDTTGGQAIAFASRAGGGPTSSLALERDLSPTLTTNVGMAVAFDLGQITSPTHRRQPKDLAGALSGNGREAVAFNARQDPDVSGAVTHALDTDGHSQGVQTPNGVRRLTPRECERLQGFPDDYTLITYRKHPSKDGPRYKVLGNSMPVPVMRWIGQRIELVDRLETR